MKSLLHFASLALILAGFVDKAVAQNQWDSPTNKVVILAVNSHPDDEGIFFGGTLPYYAKALKVPIVLVSMTSGDWYPTNLPIREAELECAATKYGFRYQPVFARFRDVPSQSMAGNPYTNKIDATWDFWADGVLQGDGSDVEAGKSKAIAYVAEQIRRYRPEVVITHDAKGEYGHHNHIATSCAVTNAFFMAADPNAAVPNLNGLPPWQAKKLYLHLYPGARLFHDFTEIPLPQLSHRTARQISDEALDCHVSQKMPDVSTVFRTGENFDGYSSEWWGLFASAVGPDTVLTTTTNTHGYPIPSGVAFGNFLENLGITNTPTPPVFPAKTVVLQAAIAGQQYLLSDFSAFATDLDLPWGDTLAFEKLSGPAWLTVSSVGTLSGLPGTNDIGTGVFTLRVRDSYGLSAEGSLAIPVKELFPQVQNVSGWWTLDDTVGATTCTDSGPFTLNATYSGSVQLGVSGAKPATDRAARFDGIDGKADVPFSPALNPPVFTAALWVNVLGGSNTYRSPLTSRNGAPQLGYLFYAGQNNTWQFWVGTGSSWKTLAAGPVRTNVWIHLAGTYDGTTAKFYTNGTLAATSGTAFQPNTASPLRIGAGASESSGQYWFPGMVDDVRIYNRALDEAQIAALCSNSPPAFSSEPPAASAFAGTRFLRSLDGLATDDSGPVRFGKVSGPDWLRVDSSGSLHGVPTSADVGPNSFRVGVSDAYGAMDTASLEVYVLPGRMPSFNGFASQNSPFTLSLSGQSGQTYLLEAAESLSSRLWYPVATNTSGAPVFEWTDASSTQHTQRFFRISIP